MPAKKPHRVKSCRTFSREFKLQVLHEIDAGTSIAEATRVHDIHPETIRVWRKMERKYGGRSFAGNGRACTDEARIAQLERTLGQLTLENALLKNVKLAQGTGSKKRRASMIAIRLRVRWSLPKDQAGFDLQVLAFVVVSRR